MTTIDAQTLQQLIDDHGAALTLYARQWCRAPEDAVQEALIALVRQHPPPDRPASWLYTAVRRRAMNLARSEKRRAAHQQKAGQQQAWFVGSNTDDGFDCQAMLAKLDRLEREIVVARIWGDLTFSQIAELVKQPLSSVHRRYRRALSELQDMIQQQGSPVHEPRTSIS